MPIPISTATVSDDQYHLRVGRDGDLRWNGQLVSASTLDEYIHEFARLPASAGRLSIEFETGVPTNRKAWVRDLIVNGGLCRQHRCVEADWGIKTRIIY